MEALLLSDLNSYCKKFKFSNSVEGAGMGNDASELGKLAWSHKNIRIFFKTPS